MIRRALSRALDLAIVAWIVVTAPVAAAHVGGWVAYDARERAYQRRQPLEGPRS